jgi:hypothetical protein
MREENYDYLKNKLGLEEVILWSHTKEKFFIVRNEAKEIVEIVGTDLKNYGIEVLMLSPTCIANKPGEIIYRGEVINTFEWRDKYDNSRVDQRVAERRS